MSRGMAIIKKKIDMSKIISQKILKKECGLIRGILFRYCNNMRK